MRPRTRIRGVGPKDPRPAHPATVARRMQAARFAANPNPQPKEPHMSRKQTPAAVQFADLGLTVAEFTPAMALAIKQRWNGLDLTAKVGDLRDRLAAVEPTPTPTEAELAADLIATIPDGIERAGKAATEAKRLAGNAKVNAWRERGRLQAAIDARGLKFAKMRAGVKAPKPVEVSTAATDEAPFGTRSVADLLPVI